MPVLTKLNLADELKTRQTITVPVPQWGKDAEIMVTKRTVAGYVYQSNLQRRIAQMPARSEKNPQGLTDEARTGLVLCAQIMSVMVHPDNGDFLLPESELENFAMQVNEDTLEALMLADAELNPLKEYISLAEKKSES